MEALSSCWENVNGAGCIWFNTDNQRNSLVSLAAGALFFIGWWSMIDAAVVYPNEVYFTHFICGIVGTVSLLMVNSVAGQQPQDIYGGEGGLSSYRIWMFIGFVLGFSSVIGATWILFANFATSEKVSTWPGIALFIHNFFIFLSSLIYRFARMEEDAY